MTDVIRDAYDATPYESRPIATSHMDNVATVARLHGIVPCPIDRWRVLELGCASGGNLIPMAHRFRDATFLGIDLSPAQIAVGQKQVAALGLTNITLETRSILDVDASDGTFDYIICHGVYSWVPPDVQDAILRICSECLAPTGVAYVSYNTYPGWHARMTVRQMLMLNDDPDLPPMERVARARKYIEDIQSRVVVAASAHGHIMRQEVKALGEMPDSQLLHEQLEPYNQPFLVTEFVRRAEARGLEYVADARLPRSRWPDPDATETLTPEAVVRREQDADFTLGQAFRRTLLTKPGARTDSTPPDQILRSMHVVMRARRVPPSDDPDERAPNVEVFQAPDGVRLGTASEAMLTLFTILGEASPSAVPFAEVETELRHRLSDDAGELVADHARDLARLPQLLLRVARAGMVDILSLPNPFTTRVSDLPVASKLARWQVEYGTGLADLRHASVVLPPLAVFLLPALDGTRDRHQLVSRIERALDDGRLRVPTRPSREQLYAIVDETLRCIAGAALLES